MRSLLDDCCAVQGTPRTAALLLDSVGLTPPIIGAYILPGALLRG